MPSSVLNAGTAEKPGMKCPVCLVALVMSERQTIEIDYCPSAGVCGLIAENWTR